MMMYTGSVQSSTFPFLNIGSNLAWSLFWLGHCLTGRGWWRWRRRVRVIHYSTRCIRSGLWSRHSSLWDHTNVAPVRDIHLVRSGCTRFSGDSATNWLCSSASSHPHLSVIWNHCWISNSITSSYCNFLSALFCTLCSFSWKRNSTSDLSSHAKFCWHHFQYINLYHQYSFTLIGLEGKKTTTKKAITICRTNIQTRRAISWWDDHCLAG